MSEQLPGLQLLLLAAMLFVGAGSLAAGGATALLGRWLARWEPRARHHALTLLALLPVLLAAALVLAALLPSLLALGSPGFDHCADHDDGHAHLCFVHPPTAAIHPSLLLALAFVGSWLAARGAIAAGSIVRAARLMQALARTGRRCPDLGATILETDQPICLAAGLFSARVFVSRGLLAALGGEARAVVLAHEHAHVRRRDALVGALVRAAAALHLPPVGRWLVRELEIAAEQACDEEAGAVVGDRVAVAEAILVVERASSASLDRALAPICVAFGQVAIERRVTALLAPPATTHGLRVVAASLASLAALKLLVSDELHHFTESLLALLAH